MTIGCAGLEFPEHELTLSKSKTNHKPQAKKSVQVCITLSKPNK